MKIGWTLIRAKDKQSQNALAHASSPPRPPASGGPFTLFQFSGFQGSDENPIVASTKTPHYEVSIQGSGIGKGDAKEEGSLRSLAVVKSLFQEVCELKCMSPKLMC